MHSLSSDLHRASNFLRHSITSCAITIIFSLWLLPAQPSIAQQNGIYQSCDFIITETGAKFIRWHAKTAHTYFIQVSDSADHLRKWNYAPLIESGHDQEISLDVDGTPEKGFFRLHYTDQAIPPGQTVDTADFDGDGLTNSQEVGPPFPLVATSPLNSDTDSDGLSDDWERAHQTDPNNPSDAASPFQGTAITNLQAQQNGVQANPNASSSNHDGDSLDNELDADPTDILVDWESALESSFTMIEIQGGGYPQDLNDQMEVLFHDGVWSKGVRQNRSFPELTGPTTDGTFHSNFELWTHFNNDQKLAGISDLWYAASQGHAVDLQSTVTWSPPDAPSELAGQIPFWDYIGPHMYPTGITRLGEVVTSFEYLTDEDPDPNVENYIERSKIARFSSNGILDSYLPIPDGQRCFFTGFYPSTRVSTNGWTTALLAPVGSDTPTSFDVALWSPQNVRIPLPNQASGYHYKLNLTELPTQKVALTAASGEYLQTQVFVSSASGTPQHLSRLSGKYLQVFAADGTAMTSNNKLWRNGEFIPMRDLCPKFGELLDQSYNLFPFKGNRYGAYLVAAADTQNQIRTFIVTPFEFIPQSESQVLADDHLIHLAVKLGNGSIPESGDLDPFEGATIEWQIESGSGGVLTDTETLVKDGLTATTLTTTTTKGEVYRVKARIKKLGVNGADIANVCSWILSSPIEVVAGKANFFTFTTTKANYRSDGTDTTEIAATIEDQYGNLVEDGTSVSWSVDQTPTPPFDTVENSTTGGIAKAVLHAPLVPEDQIVTCISGEEQDTVTVGVDRVTGSISGNVNLDIGAAQQSSVTVNAVAADGTPVYWTTSNGEITQQSTITSGTATAALHASNGRLGKVVVTATVGDRLFIREGDFTSSSDLAIGADHPVLIAGATADGVSTRTFAHGIPRQIPYYASTAVRVKGPPNSIAHLTVQASSPLVEWDFDQAVANVTPSKMGAYGMTLFNSTIDETVQYTGSGSILFDGAGSCSLPDDPIFHFTDQFNVSFWIRPTEHSAATLATKSGLWQISTLADGRVQASVTTQTGIHTATTQSPIEVEQWAGVTVDFRFNRLQIKLDSQLATLVNTTGTVIVNTSPIVVGSGFHGNLDSLKFCRETAIGSQVGVSGLGPNQSLALDANGAGTFMVSTHGASVAGTSIRIFCKVNPEAETEVALVDPSVWDYTCDTVMSFIGGDPATGVGTASSIAGGFLLVGDIGSCTKNLWRMTGWSEKKPNYVELSLGGLGILTTFVEFTVVGAPADAGVASVKTLAIRFVGNPKAEKFLTVFINQIKNAALGVGNFGWAEANFLQKMVTDVPVADAFKLFMHDDALARAAIHATKKLGANAESFYQATRRAVAAHGEEAAKKFVQAFDGLGNEALNALKNAPASELDKALDGLAKVANKGIAPFALKRVLDNAFLYGSQYKRTDLLKDLGELAEVKGLDLLVGVLTSANNKGFRYELEGAAWLKRSGKTIFELSRRVPLSWKKSPLEDATVRTDIDVIVLEGTNLVHYQFKRSRDAFMGGCSTVAEALEKNQAWVAKAMKDLGIGASHAMIRYATPPGATIPRKIGDWFNSLDPVILVERIPHLD